jgi:hypothetical protein
MSEEDMVRMYEVRSGKQFLYSLMSPLLFCDKPRPLPHWQVHIDVGAAQLVFNGANLNAFQESENRKGATSANRATCGRFVRSNFGFSVELCTRRTGNDMFCVDSDYYYYVKLRQLRRRLDIGYSNGGVRD